MAVVYDSLFLCLDNIFQFITILQNLFTKFVIFGIDKFCQFVIIVVVTCQEGYIMKATGIIRRIDDLGRLVFPIEIRRVLDINEDDRIEIYVVDNKIVCKKYINDGRVINTSVIRPVDALGRTVIPMEVRKLLNLPVKAKMQIFIDGNAIVLKQFEDKCVFCGSEENLVSFKDKKLCPDCIEMIKQI